MRRIRVGGKDVYQVRPSHIMPYQIGHTSEIEPGLYMYCSGSSFDAVVHNHGHNQMFWWRAVISLGRNSIVGTTVKASEKMPVHLVVDEKHTQWYSEKIYVATTVGNGCILGSALAFQADETCLREAYGEFESEALALEPAYHPESVNTDGWGATQNTWKALFGGSAGLLLCFLHAALKIQDRCRRWEKKKELMTKVWDCYKAKTLSCFSQQLRRLREWVLQTPDMPDSARGRVFDLCQRANSFKRAYHYPKGHRTSNPLDRLMDFQDRFLYKMRYLHGDLLSGSANLMVRAIALMWNFHPFGAKTKRHSPFADLNHFVYHSNWLENLNIAASLGGRYFDINRMR